MNGDDGRQSTIDDDWRDPTNVNKTTDYPWTGPTVFTERTSYPQIPMNDLADEAQLPRSLAQPTPPSEQERELHNLKTCPTGLGVHYV